MSHLPLLPIIILLSLLPALTTLPTLPNPDPSPTTTFHPTPTRTRTGTPPTTIPSSPEQSAVSGCPLTLPTTFFPAIKSSCSTSTKHGQLPRRDQCCPTLALWLYSATLPKMTSSSYDSMPLLPDDSETCAVGIENAMRENGVHLVRPNATCDVVYCFCGIRLRPLSCPTAFQVGPAGEVVGGVGVKRLERDCLSYGRNGSEDGCSKCLDSLYKLKKGGNRTKLEARTNKMRMRDCELMGLTWLLHKNKDAYISTVTKVMRALMINPQDSDPRSCSLNSDGMPLAVDSLDINGQASFVTLQSHVYLYGFALFLLFMSPNVSPYCF